MTATGSGHAMPNQPENDIELPPEDELTVRGVDEYSVIVKWRDWATTVTSKEPWGYRGSTDFIVKTAMDNYRRDHAKSHD